MRQIEVELMVDMGDFSGTPSDAAIECLATKLTHELKCDVRPIPDQGVFLETTDAEPGVRRTILRSVAESFDQPVEVRIYHGAQVVEERKVTKDDLSAL